MNKIPSPFGPIPSQPQLAWHCLEIYGFIHFTTNTFTDLEWGYGDESPDVFTPTALDCRQWVRVAKDGGLKGLILTCKHHDGFCLWPSAFTEHSVKHSSWRDGRGDVVRELADACREAGLKFGIYLSPWDRNHPRYAFPEYVDYYHAQLRELLMKYGPIFEVWHDGANGGDGFYGGACETRKIDASTYYGWPEIYQITRKLQPDAVIFGERGSDIRWVGNESGIATETTWCTYDDEKRILGSQTSDDYATGFEGGTHWIPPETDVSIRPGWFYHASEDESVKSVEHLTDIYFQSVGYGTSLLLNLPPDRRGLIHETDAARLREWCGLLDRTFAQNLARDAIVTATSSFAPDYAPASLTDGDPETYWAATDSDRTATITLDFAHPVTFNLLQVQETIFLGQRVRKWQLEAQTSEGHWQTITSGTTIGYKRLARFAPVTTQRLCLRITDSLASPILTSLSLFYNLELTG